MSDHEETPVWVRMVPEGFVQRLEELAEQWKESARASSEDAARLHNARFSEERRWGARAEARADVYTLAARELRSLLDSLNTPEHVGLTALGDTRVL